MTGTEGQDWAGYQVAAPSTAGLGFVFVKATEGGSYVNPKHDSQVAHVRADGLVVGHYHFQRPGSPTGQAAFFLKHARPQPGDVLACDWEDTGVSCADKDQFIRAVRAAQPHLRTVLYCNRDFWLHRDTTSFVGDGLWIADPSAPKGQPRITADWLFHQYSDAGGLDRDYTPLSAADLHAWAAGTTPITPQQENGMDWNDRLTAGPGTWNKAPITTSAEKWLIYANLKAGAAADAAARTLVAITAANASIGALVKLLGDQHDSVDTAQVVAAVQQAIKDEVIKVDVNITGDQPTA